MGLGGGGVYPTSYPEGQEGPITSEPSTFQGTHCGGWEGSDGVFLEEEGGALP